MIGEWIDGAVALISPARAAKRAHARNVYRNISGSGYPSGQPSRAHENWRPANRSPDLEMSGTADETRARARALVRENAYARGILNAKVRNVVGAGIRPQCRVKNGNELDREFVAAAEKLFRRWAKVCDITGRLHFFEMQAAVVREVHESGECLVHFVASDDPARPVKLALELIDADQIASDAFYPRNINLDTGNEVRRGIEIDAAGRPVAYWVYRHHPNDVNSLKLKMERLDAANVLHIFRQERIGQTRGMSSFAPVVWWLKNLGFYVENEMQSSAVASCFGVAIKTIDGGATDSLGDAASSEATDSTGRRFGTLHPGMIAELLPGEDITTINPSRQASNSAEFINLMLRSMAVGTGLSYERLSRDYSKTNYSSNRASDLEDRREFRMEQQWLINVLCEPVWKRLMIHGVAEGADGFPDDASFLGDFDEWTEHAWLPPGWEWVDPKNEAEASKIALETVLTTLTDELGDRGRDLEDTLRTRHQELALIAELGLPKLQQQTNPDPAMQPPPDKKPETVHA